MILPAIDGSTFDNATLHGTAYMLTFYRFASCPFCNMRLHNLINRYHEFGSGFTLVAIFDSPIDNLIQHTEGHHAPFPILADVENIYYKEFGIQQSFSGLLKGMFTRMPTMIQGMARGYIPTTIKGSIITMPADFLIDQSGIIERAYYGKDEGDHLATEEVIAFSKR